MSTVAQLKEKAKKLGLHGYSKMDKASLQKLVKSGSPPSSRRGRPSASPNSLRLKKLMASMPQFTPPKSPGRVPQFTPPSSRGRVNVPQYTPPKSQKRVSSSYLNEDDYTPAEWAKLKQPTSPGRVNVPQFTPPSSRGRVNVPQYTPPKSQGRVSSSSSYLNEDEYTPAEWAELKKGGSSTQSEYDRLASQVSRAYNPVTGENDLLRFNFGTPPYGPPMLRGGHFEEDPARFDRILRGRDLTTKEAWKKWIARNHPDRGGDMKMFVDVLKAGKSRFNFCG